MMASRDRTGPGPSVDNLQSELNVARFGESESRRGTCVPGRGHLPERSAGKRCGGWRPVRAVEQVEDFDAELSLNSFPEDREILEHRVIYGTQAGPVDRIPSQIAERSRSRFGERRRVEVIYRKRSRRRDIRKRIADKIFAVFVLPRTTNIATGEKVERLPSGEGYQRVKLPSASYKGREMGRGRQI